MSETNTQHGGALHLSYHFKAPRELVFNAFSTEDALNQWWGPVETENSVIKLDFRTGGIFHYKMEAGGRTNYARFVFGEIRPYDLLEFTVAFTDDQANIVPAPFDIPLPAEIFYRLEFVENAGITTILLTGKPVNASDVENDSFQAIRPDMQRGFGATFDALTTYLKQF